MKFAVFLCLTCSFVSGCATTMTYPPDYPLDETIFISRDGILRGYVPVGWFSSAEDSLAPALQAWLLREDCRAEITFRRLQLDETTIERVEHQGIVFVARATMPLYDSTDHALRPEPETYRLGEYHCAAFEAASENGRMRVVLVEKKPAFYECVARFLSPSASVADTQTLFRTQQSVLLSLSLVR